MREIFMSGSMRGMWKRRAPATSSASRTGQSTPSLTALCLRAAERSLSQQRRRSIACYCGITYVVPQWTTDKLRIARWDRFSRPETMPEYGIDAFPTTWWWDARRAANTA